MDNKLPGNHALPNTQAELAKLIDFDKNSYTYSVEDFFRKPDQTGFQLSPDGQWFIYQKPYHRRMNIFIRSTATQDAEEKQLTFEKEQELGGFTWANNDTVLFVKDNKGDENYTLFSIDIHTATTKALTPFEKVKINIIDLLPEDDAHILIGMNHRSPQLFEPYKINVRTGEMVRKADNIDLSKPISGWLTNHEGQILGATMVVNGVENVLLHRSSEEEPFKEVLKTNFKESVSPLFYHLNDKNKLYVSSNLGRDKSVITTLDMNTGAETGEILFEHPEVDVNGLSYSRKRKKLTLISYTTDKRRYHFLDSQRQKLQEDLEEKLPGVEIVIVSTNREEDKLLIRTYSDKSLGAYYFYDIKSALFYQISEVSPWLDSANLSSMQPIRYQSRDGLTINGYLSLPADYEGGAIPFVVNPHGGPWVRDGWGYNPEVQLLNSRGYGVLKMNYRGSTGYGKAFWEASFKQWGKKMQDDISDGVQWLIDEGYADASKVAIYGGSYGGYATLAGVAFTPDLYACAIDYVGVSNLLTFMNSMPPYWKPYIEMMYEMVGHPEKETADMEARSPALHVDKIKTPLYVVQGAYDPRVNIDESDQIVERLRAKGVEVPYMVKYDEGHGFQKEENQFEFYKTMLGFLAKHLKNN